MTRDEALSIVADAADRWAHEIREYIPDIDDRVADEIDEALLLLTEQAADVWHTDPLHEQIGDDPRA